jgi:hypothetical protein
MQLDVPLSIMHALMLALAFGGVALYWAKPQ